ncbi:MAG TPA: hypothetical protein VM513_18905 [Kofleriaceae bacterium]|nr:hypothetical protein [Kofleriaceae bacterium]
MWRVVIIPSLLAGCQVQLDVEEVRLSYRNVEVKGGGNGMGASKHGFTFDDLSALEELVELGADIRFAGAELRATSGVDDMSFVDQLQLAVASADPDAGLPALVLYGCKGNCGAHGQGIEMKPEKKPHAGDYLGTGSLLIDLDIVGKLPGKPWTLDVDVVLEAHAEYELGR